jgi:hypothetical protein
VQKIDDAVFFAKLSPQAVGTILFIENKNFWFAGA